jgi:hypothetical protein
MSTTPSGDQERWKVIFIGAFALLYALGMYEVMFDSRRHNASDKALALLIPLYPPFVGGKMVYRYVAHSKEQRSNEDKCLTKMEAQNYSAIASTAVCSCVFDANPSQCVDRVIKKYE